MSLYFELETVENNKKSLLNFREICLIFVILFTFLYLPQISTLKLSVSFMRDSPETVTRPAFEHIFSNKQMVCTKIEN